jgi:predicted metal-dependent HD superfamily phosphohydrolase
MIVNATHRIMMSQRWNAQWQGLGVATPLDLFDELVAGYTLPQRAYHNLNHIEFCLEQYESARGLAVQPAIVEAAIWFHDAIYDPRRADNEEQSAAWAASALAEAGVEPTTSQRLADLILATKHDHPPTDDDMALLLDIDLAILGQSPAVFEQYEQAIRQEYRSVDEALFRRRRAAILQGFLDRERIYVTESFYVQYEQQARCNLVRSIERLSGHAALA